MSPFLITQCFINGTVNIQYCMTKIRYNIGQIKPCKSDTNVPDINHVNMYDDVNIRLPVIYFILILKLGKKSIQSDEHGDIYVKSS